jgi:hypothetical protein
VLSGMQIPASANKRNRVMWAKFQKIAASVLLLWWRRKSWSFRLLKEHLGGKSTDHGDSSKAFKDLQGRIDTEINNFETMVKELGQSTVNGTLAEILQAVHRIQAPYPLQSMTPVPYGGSTHQSSPATPHNVAHFQHASLSHGANCPCEPCVCRKFHGKGCICAGYLCK